MAGATDQTPAGGDATYEANADLRTKQYYILELTNVSGVPKVQVCNNSGDIGFGVLYNKPNTGQEARVRLAPGAIARVVSDGSGTAIDPGDKVGTDGNGKAVKKTTDKDWILGWAEEASTADGTIISVRLDPQFLSI